MSGKLQSILLAGAGTGVLMTLMSLSKIGQCLACLGYILAGVAVVWHYTNTNELTITGGEGAGAGALGGVVAAIAGAIFAFILQAAGLMPTTKEEFQRQIDSGEIPDEALETVGPIFEFLSSDMGLLAMVALGCVFGAILGAIGGAIGASVFKKGGEFPA